MHITDFINLYPHIASLGKLAVENQAKTTIQPELDPERLLFFYSHRVYEIPDALLQDALGAELLIAFLWNRKVQNVWAEHQKALAEYDKPEGSVFWDFFTDCDEEALEWLIEGNPSLQVANNIVDWLHTTVVSCRGRNK